MTHPSFPTLTFHASVSAPWSRAFCMQPPAGRPVIGSKAPRASCQGDNLFQTLTHTSRWQPKAGASMPGGWFATEDMRSPRSLAMHLEQCDTGADEVNLSARLADWPSLPLSLRLTQRHGYVASSHGLISFPHSSLIHFHK